MRSLLQHVVVAATLAVVGAPEIRAGSSCVPGPDVLCLQGNRFSVEVDWEDPMSVTGRGQVMAYVIGDDTGFFYFNDGRYLELLIKVLDACSLPGFETYWVFFVGLSDYMQTITVTDTVAGVVKTYFSPQGQFPPVVTDTRAFSTCAFPVALGRERSWMLKGPALPLASGRFSLEVEWRDFIGSTGPGNPMPLTSHSGYFWFFHSSNPELAVKVFDGSAVDGYFWVTFGATTDVEYTLWVTDQLCQESRSFFNPLGRVGDIVSAPFPEGCASIFADGFESGDLFSWTAGD